LFPAKGNPEVTVGFSAKMVIHDLDDWGSPFLGNPHYDQQKFGVDDQWDVLRENLTECCGRNLFLYRQIKGKTLMVPLHFPPFGKHQCCNMTWYINGI